MRSRASPSRGTRAGRPARRRPPRRHVQTSANPRRRRRAAVSAGDAKRPRPGPAREVGGERRPRGDGAGGGVDRRDVALAAALGDEPPAGTQRREQAGEQRGRGRRSSGTSRSRGSRRRRRSSSSSARSATTTSTRSPQPPAGLVHHRGRAVDRDHLSGGQALEQRGGHAPGAAAGVEHALVAAQLEAVEHVAPHRLERRRDPLVRGRVPVPRRHTLVRYRVRRWCGGGRVRCARKPDGEAHWRRSDAGEDTGGGRRSRSRPLGGAVRPAAFPAAAQVPENRLLAFDDGQVARVGSLRAGATCGCATPCAPTGARPRSARGAAPSRARCAGSAPASRCSGTTFDTPPRRRCDTRRLHIQRIVVNGAGWTTDAGLAVGEPLARLRALPRRRAFGQARLRARDLRLRLRHRADADARRHRQPRRGGALRDLGRGGRGLPANRRARPVPPRRRRAPPALRPRGRAAPLAEDVAETMSGSELSGRPTPMRTRWKSALPSSRLSDFSPLWPASPPPSRTRMSPNGRSISSWRTRTRSRSSGSSPRAGPTERPASFM